MNRILLTLLLSFIVTTINADPAPFGLEINKATVSDVKKKYKTQHSGENKYTGGDMYYLDTSAIGIEGLQSVNTIFDKENKLVAVMTTFQKSKFNFLLNTMKQKKYKLLEKSIPFVGDKTARFIHGKTLVLLDAPHLSFKMTLYYFDNNTYKDFKNKQRENYQQNKRAEQSKL